MKRIAIGKLEPDTTIVIETLNSSYRYTAGDPEGYGRISGGALDASLEGRLAGGIGAAAAELSLEVLSVGDIALFAVRRPLAPDASAPERSLGLLRTSEVVSLHVLGSEDVNRTAA